VYDYKTGNALCKIDGNSFIDYRSGGTQFVMEDNYMRDYSLGSTLYYWENENFVDYNTRGSLYKLDGNYVYDYKLGGTLYKIEGDFHKKALAYIFAIKIAEGYKTNKPIENNKVEVEKAELGKATGTFDVGSLVAIRWCDEKYWLARIESFKGDEFYCLTGDGQFASVNKKNMVALTGKTEYIVGDKVMAAYTNMKFYSGSIDKIEKDGAIVKWADRSAPIFVKFNMISLPFPVKTDYNVGEKVMAKWLNSSYYSGSIEKIEKEGAVVKWDDGSAPIFVKFNMMYLKD
jgi:hypothetical protein